MQKRFVLTLIAIDGESYFGRTILLLSMLTMDYDMLTRIFLSRYPFGSRKKGGKVDGAILDGYALKNGA